MSNYLNIDATTVLAVRHNGKLAIAADGQATMGNTVAKGTVNKLRRLDGGKILVGFAGSTADAFTLLERFQDKLASSPGNFKKAAVELAKDWRTDRYLRRLEALMLAGNANELLLIAGSGDVIEPDHNLAAIGSGGMYAQAAALALVRKAPHLSAKEVVETAMNIAADICIYTNHNINIEEL